MTKLYSGQGNPDTAADTTTAAATTTTDKSNPYMSPFQETQKCLLVGLPMTSKVAKLLNKILKAINLIYYLRNLFFHNMYCINNVEPYHLAFWQLQIYKVGLQNRAIFIIDYRN